VAQWLRCLDSLPSDLPDNRSIPKKQTRSPEKGVSDPLCKLRDFKMFRRPCPKNSLTSAWGRVLKAGQVPHFPLADFVDRSGWHMLSTPRTNQLQPRLLPPHPQLQMLITFVNLHAIHLVSRPSKNSRPVVFPHPLRLAKDPSQRKLAFLAVSRIPAQCR
jgi:hypothetical protein